MDNETNALEKLMVQIENKSVMKHESQIFEQYIFQKANETEEKQVLRTVQIVSTRDVPITESFVNSQKLYNITHKDNEKQKLKAKVTFHNTKMTSKNKSQVTIRYILQLVYVSLIW